MWSWGTGLALGHGGDEDSQQLLPKVIEDLPAGASILRIAAAGYMAACVRTDGTTLSWGNNLESALARLYTIPIHWRKLDDKPRAHSLGYDKRNTPESLGYHQ